jgi:surface carbohydrate biosynthesis protein
MSAHSWRPPVYLAMETKVREMDAKILLSAVLALRGYRVLLGYKTDLDALMKTLPPGIYIDKSAASTKTEKFRNLRRGGHAVMVHDEEGLVIHNPQQYLSHRVAGDSIHELSRFFLWGGEQEKIIRTKFPQYAEKLVVTGNPRFDLLRGDIRTLFNRETEALRQEYGHFILIATKFGTNNNQMGKEKYLQSEIQNSLIKSEGDYEFRKGYFSFREKLFNHFIELVEHVSLRNPDQVVVVRPHPSENMAAWVKLVAHLPNVRVVREGNVQPWIMAADLLLHNGCTTAIEAAMLDVPAISYRPVKSDRFDIPLPNALSLEATTLEEVDDLVASILVGEQCVLTPEQKALLGMHLAEVTGPRASDHVADAIESYTSFATFPPSSLSLRLQHEILRRVRQGRASLRSLLLALPFFGSYYHKPNLKFPDMKQGEVCAFLANLSLLDPEFSRVCARPYSHNCVVIDASDT